MSQQKIKNTSVFKDFNNSQWYIDIKLTDISESFYIQLDANNIFRLKFKNTLEQFVPTMELCFTDYNFLISKYIKFVGLVFIVNIKQPIQTDNLYEKTKYDGELNATYVINNVTTLQQDKDKITYQFFSEEINVFNFIKNINYATNKKNSKSPYEIIQEVCHKANIVMDSDYVDTSLKIDFINAQTMNVIDIIKYCLAMGAFSKNVSPSYFFSRFLDQTSMLFNQMSKNPALINPCNLNLHITGKYIDGGNILGNYIKNIELNSNENQINNLMRMGTKAFYDFNHNERKWNTTVFSSENILKTLIKLLTNQNTQEPSVWNSNFFSNQFINNFPNYSHYKLYNIMRDIELCTSNLSFECLGNFKRDCGQAIFLHSADIPFQRLFTNLWIIYSCEHEFENKTYTNQITCYKTVQQIPPKDEK